MTTDFRSLAWYAAFYDVCDVGSHVRPDEAFFYELGCGTDAWM